MTEKHRKTNSRKTEYRQPMNLNIGKIIFGIILLYVLYSVFRYATTKHVSGYEVRTGCLQTDTVYKGIALREETVYNSEYAGHINFYSQEGERLGVGDLAYTVDESGKVDEQLSADEAQNSVFSSDDYDDLRTDIADFSKNFSASDFSQIYDFKNSLSTTIQKTTNNSILNNIGSMQGAGSTSVHYGYTTDTGYIVYYTDGYENLTFDAVTADDLVYSNYSGKRTEIENNSLVASGSPAYKLETAEDWSVVVRLADETEAETLNDLGIVKVRFLKNQYESYATITVRQDEEGIYYANLAFTNSMCTFCTDRFIDVELMTSAKSGLKIPKTALINDTFYLIPSDYVTEGTGGKQIVLRQTVDEDGKQTTESVTVVPYSLQNSMYYIGMDSLAVGDILVAPDSQKTMTVSSDDDSTATLTGVYNINKGYADFREVNIIDENEEYAIVDPEDSYGLREYDFIVLDASRLSPDEFLYE